MNKVKTHKRVVSVKVMQSTVNKFLLQEWLKVIEDVRQSNHSWIEMNSWTVVCGVNDKEHISLFLFLKEQSLIDYKQENGDALIKIV